MLGATEIETLATLDLGMKLRTVFPAAFVVGPFGHQANSTPLPDVMLMPMPLTAVFAADARCTVAW